MVVKTNSKVGVSNEPMFRMIKLSCERGRVYEDQLSKRGQVRKSNGVINTKKPTHKVEMCGFFLTVYQRTSDNRLLSNLSWLRGLTAVFQPRMETLVQHSYSGRGHEIFPLIKFYLSIIKRTLSLALNRLPQMVWSIGVLHAGAVR